MCRHKLHLFQAGIKTTKLHATHEASLFIFTLDVFNILNYYLRTTISNFPLNMSLPTRIL